MDEDRPRDETPIDLDGKGAEGAKAEEAKDDGVRQAEVSGRREEDRKDDDSPDREGEKAGHSASESGTREDGASEANPGEGNPGGGFMPDNQTLLLVAGGALAALAVLNFDSIFSKLRPLAVAAVKEGYGFTEWLAAKVEGAKEDIEDIVAEGIHEHYAERAAASEAAEREKELRGAMERIVERRTRGKRAGRKEEAS